MIGALGSYVRQGDNNPHTGSTEGLLGVMDGGFPDGEPESSPRYYC